MKKYGWWLVGLFIAGSFTVMHIQAGGPIDYRPANSGLVKSVNGLTGDVTVAAGGLPLPNNDTGYLQLNASQTVTGSPVFIAMGSMTSVGTVSSTSGFTGGLAQFSSMTVAGTITSTSGFNGGVTKVSSITSAGTITSTSGFSGGYAQFSSMTVFGTVSSTTGFVGGGSTFTTIAFPDGSIQTTRAGGDNLGSHVATTTIQAPFGINSSSGVFTSSLTAYGGFYSTGGIVAAGSTFTLVNVSGSSVAINNGSFTLVFASAPNTAAGQNHLIITQINGTNYLIGSGGDVTGAAGGGGNNQLMNTSTMTLISPAFEGGGAVFLATSPRVAIPGKAFSDARSTFNVVSIQAFTLTVSTALDANVSFVLAESTPSSNGAYHIISSTAEVVSSSGSLSVPIEFSTEISTTFVMWPRYSYSVLITSVASGPSLPAENWGFKVRGWWSP